MKDHRLTSYMKDTLPASIDLTPFVVQVGKTLVEAAKFEVPGFATRFYMVAASEGKVVWDEAAPDG